VGLQYVHAAAHCPDRWSRAGRAFADGFHPHGERWHLSKFFNTFSIPSPLFSSRCESQGNSPLTRPLRSQRKRHWADLHWLLSQIPPSNDGRVHLFSWPEQSAYLSGIWLAQWGKSMSERAEKAEALAARIKPILAGNDPDIKGKRRRSFLPAPQRLSPCQRGQCPAGGGLKASAGRLKVALDAAPARTLSVSRALAYLSPRRIYPRHLPLTPLELDGRPYWYANGYPHEVQL